MMAKVSENYLTGSTTSTCIMTWEIQTEELSLHDQHLEVKKFHFLEGVAPAAFLVTLVSVLGLSISSFSGLGLTNKT